MMSQFMAQGGHGVSGKAIKWRKTSVNVPFSLFSGNIKMFSNIPGLTVTVLLLPGEDDTGFGGRKENTSRSSSGFCPFPTADTFFLPSCMEKKRIMFSQNLDSPPRTVGGLIRI